MRILLANIYCKTLNSIKISQSLELSYLDGNPADEVQMRHSRSQASLVEFWEADNR
jgi:hypothetical protein